MPRELLFRIVLPSCILFAFHVPAARSQMVEYYHLDAQGNVRAVTDAAGKVIQRYDYLPFGEEWVPQVGFQPLRFAGKERDAETGLDYFGARYYGSIIGRFTTVDPVYTWRENLVDPQRWNRYAYGRNNPLRFVDPDGRELRTTHFQRMHELAGLDPGRIQIVGGILDVSAVQPSDLTGNEGALLLFQLATSPTVYSYAEGQTIQTRAGSRPVSGTANLDTRPDSRLAYRGGKSPTDLPPAGIDSSVVIDPNALYITQMGNLPVSPGALAFHELAEAYGRVDRNLTYAGAHAEAGVRERTLVQQRPSVTQGLAGEPVKRIR